MSVALAAIFAPLAAALLILLFRRAGPALSLLGAVAALLAAFVSLPSTSAGVLYRASYEWLPGLPLVIELDPLTALLSVTVAAVGFLVLLYAVGYMAGEPRPDSARFYAGMSFFLAAMQALVLAGDWLLFLGSWELLGLASYLLIGYRYESATAKAAGTRAFLTTRAADIGLYLGVFLLVSASGSTVMAETLAVGGSVASAAGLLLLIAAAGKAAQVPFQRWLAAAMAGPTPVSALLHSATLVAAGVILIMRAFSLMPPGVLLVVGTLGGSTAIIAGLTALAERDLKRVLAASTSGQLGLMFVALGAGSLAAAAFYLVTHAAMKSALFLAAGVFQHERGSTKFSRLRGVGRELPWAYAGFVVAGLALAGLPPLAGFWAKDAVLAAALRSGTPWLLFPLALVGSLLTAMYLARALKLLWVSEPLATASTSSNRAHSPRPVSSMAGSPAGRSLGTDSPPVGPPSGGSPLAVPRPGTWMSIGLSSLAVAAALLGFLSGPFERLLTAELPEEPWAGLLGIVIAVLGLAGGWLLRAEQLLGSLRPLAESGFQIAGGLGTLTVKPARRLSLAAARLDDGLHVLINATAASALAASARLQSIEQGLHRFVEGTAGASLTVARAVQLSDQAGIEALIARFSRGVRELGRAGRRLQSGLVHRELALTVASVVGLIVLLAFERLLSSTG